MGVNFGAIADKILPFDPTPGFNLGKTKGVTGAIQASGTTTPLGQGNTAGSSVANKTNTPTKKVADNGVTETPTDLGDGTGGGSNGYNPADIAYLDSQANSLRDMLSRSGVSLDQGLTGINDSFNKEVGNANTQRSRVLQDYGVQDEATNRAKDTALGGVDTNARTLADSLRRTLGLAGGSDSSAYQLAAPQAVARQASTQRNGVLNDFSENEQSITTAKDRASEDFQTLLDNLAEQRKQKESSLRGGVLQNEQSINKSLAEIAAQKAAASGTGYAGSMAAQAPYSAAISSNQGAIDELFNKFRTPTFDVKPISAEAAPLKDYTVNSAEIGTPSSQAQDPSATFSNYLRKLQQEQIA